LRRLLPGGDPAVAPEHGDVAEIERRERPARPFDLQPTIERARAFALKSVARQSVAVSAEGTSLRLLALANNRVLNWASEPLGERASRGSQINDPVALGTTIDETFDRLQLPRGRVAWALSGFNALSRILDLPGLRGEELRQAITEEVERVMGASASESFLYWQRLEGRIRRRNVFVLAIPRTTILSALEALDVANIRPRTMDLRPLALARAVGRADAIVVNLEEGSLDVVVVEQSVPTLIRSLPLPASAALTREAVQDRLVQETERTLAYYDDANPDRPLDVDAPLYLTGSLATGIGLAERMRAMTRHPIGRLAGLPPHPPEFPVSDYLVNLGLALKQA
jgi:type IV pilus assembly protein PilM